MAAEARYNDAKQNWLQAASQARTQKEAAKANYDEDKEMGITNQPFEQWVASNAPAFAAAFQNFQAASVAYQHAYAAYDQSDFQEFQQKFKDEYNTLYYRSPEGSDDYHSNTLIITPE